MPSPVVDPGHLLTKLNGDAAPKRCKRHEFSLETCLGPTIFHRTKVCLASLVDSHWISWLSLCGHWLLACEITLTMCHAQHIQGHCAHQDQGCQTANA